MTTPEQPKRGRGRPSGSTIPEAERKTKRLTILVTPEQFAKSEALGDAWMREHVRDVVRAKIDRAKVPG